MSCVVGICAQVELARWGPWEDTVTMAQRSYARSIQEAGGTAFLIPPDEAAVEDPDSILARLDALVLAGGSDVDPAAYGAEPHPETIGFRPERDAFERAVTLRAIERELPVLGICRGMQMLNVAHGGTLDQHLPDTMGHFDHRAVPGQFSDHEVRLAPGSLAQRAAGAERITVRSHHHQGVERLGEGLAATGWGEPDGLIEAIELTAAVEAGRFVLGTLWHPEEELRSKVIGALVEAARAAQGAPS